MTPADPPKNSRPVVRKPGPTSIRIPTTFPGNAAKTRSNRAKGQLQCLSFLLDIGHTFGDTQRNSATARAFGLGAGLAPRNSTHSEIGRIAFCRFQTQNCFLSDYAQIR